eukprot:TRINITY_DN25487_c0_g1_i1.p1 TRINITY_DN25487_c0_g1~~TRINITY_DN25487_c0_g1_i1.p1  ORF type:complete len:184 (-),score=9.16 TRINITY_DN25487_c0_g1_i1:111-614(-)
MHDQVYMKKLRASYAPAFEYIQTEYNDADQFDDLMCLDFLCHPKIDRQTGTAKRLPMSFVTTLCNIFPIFQKAWLRQSVYEKICLHFRSVKDVDDIWSNFKSIQVDRVFLTISPPDGPSYQVLVSRPKKRVQGCKVMFDKTSQLSTSLSVQDRFKTKSTPLKTPEPP